MPNKVDGGMSLSPTLWGPGLWHVLFVVAWHARPDQMEALRSMVFEILPRVLPCPTCRQHFRSNFGRTCRVAGDCPRTPRDMFVWIYHMKRAVNTSLRTPSIALESLTQRFEFHSGVLDAVLAADTLLMIALAAAASAAFAETSVASPGTDGSDAVSCYVALCTALSGLLPLDADETSLRTDLSLMQSPVEVHAYRICRNVRHEHGRSCPSLDHFRRFLG